MPTASLADIVSHQPPTQAPSGRASLADIAQVHAPTAQTPIAQQAEQMLQRADLPDSVRAELEAVRTGTATNSGPLANVRAMVDAWGVAGPQRVRRGLTELMQGEYVKGAHDVIGGFGVTAAPMVAPELLPAIAAAPGAAAVTAGGAMVAGSAATQLAKAAGATDDQAALAGDVAGIGAGTAIAKLGVPALTRWSVTNKGIRISRDYMQSTRDIQAALGVDAEDVHRARPFLETVHNNGIPIAGKEDAAQQLVKAADVAVEEIEQHVSGLVQQFPAATVAPMRRAILSRVSAMPGASAADIAAAEKVIAEYGLDQPRSLPNAESLRVRLNAENSSVLEGTGVRQRTATMTNPVYVARQEAANQLRDGIYGALEHNGVQGIRDLRLSEGSILKLRNAADRITSGLRGETRVARTGSRSMGRRIAQHVVRAAGAAVGAGTAGPFGAGVGAEVGQTVGSGLTRPNLSKNELLERAFRQSFTSPPLMSTQRIIRRAPGAGPSAGPPLLPAPSLPPAPTSPALPPAPPAQLGPGARPMPPVPPEEGPISRSAKSIVVRDPRTGRMRRIYISEGK